jgi:hypothetical protein
MIRRNEPVDTVNDTQPTSHEKRDFTRVLEAAGPLWEPFLPDPREHVGRGFLWLPDGMQPTADLSYDKHHRRVRLVVRLHANDAFTSMQLRSFRRVHNEAEGLSYLAIDEETNVLQIRSQSVLPAPIMAGAIVPEVVRDAVRLLGNHILKDFLQHSVSY